MSSIEPENVPANVTAAPPAVTTASENTDIDSSPESRSRIADFLISVAKFAAGFQRALGWFLLIAAIPSLALAWQLYSAESVWWWNSLKCGLVLAPLLVWLFIWQILGEVQEAPSLAATLASHPDSMLANLNTDNYREKIGIRGLFSTLRAFREEDGLDVVLDTVGGVTLLANPLFAIFALIMAVLLWFFILLSPFLLFF